MDLPPIYLIVEHLGIAKPIPFLSVRGIVASDYILESLEQVLGGTGLILVTGGSSSGKIIGAKPSWIQRVSCHCCGARWPKPRSKGVIVRLPKLIANTLITTSDRAALYQSVPKKNVGC